MDIEKLTDGELDALQKQLDERARNRALANNPMRGYRTRLPAPSKPGAKPWFGTRWEIDDVRNHVKDACGEFSICAGKDDPREFDRMLAQLGRVIESEITRGFEEYWTELDGEDREILLSALRYVEMTVEEVRKQLHFRAARLQSMVAALAEVDLPASPFSHRAGEAVSDGAAKLKDVVVSGAKRAGEAIAEGARAVKGLII